MKDEELKEQIQLEGSEDYISLEGVSYVSSKDQKGAKEINMEAHKRKRAYCRDCMYRGKDGACDYYFLTGERRGCKAGEGCDKKDTSPRPTQRLVLRGKMKL